MKQTILFLLFISVLPLMAQERQAIPYNGGVVSVVSPARDWASPATASQGADAWRRLERFTQEERLNSSLSILLGRTSSEGASNAAREIEHLWNGGRYDEALQAFPLLGQLADAKEIGLGVAWKNEVAASPRKMMGTDVRVGTRDSILMQNLQIDRATGNLMAVQMFTGDGFTYSWAAIHSTDGGATWTEKYMWWATYALNSVSAAVVHGYFYVGFTRASTQTEILMYRFNATTGANASWPSGAGFLTVSTATGADNFMEVSLCSNHNVTDNRLYCTILTNTRKVLLYWNVADSVAWTQIATPVITARNGLASVFNNGRQASLWFSYVDTLNVLCIDSLTSIGYANAFRTTTNSGGSRYTSISAYKDTILCTYEYANHNRYMINYSAGSTTWLYNVVGGDSATTSESPAATLEGGGGIAIIYRYYTPTRQERIVWRGYPSGTWSVPVSFSDNEPYYDQPALVYMGAKKFGLLYLSWTSPIRASFFDTFVASATAVQNQEGVTPVEFALHQNYPNPFNPTTVLSYQLPVAGNVTLAIFDMLGRKVTTLADGHQSAGAHQVQFNASGYASGVYICRLTAGTMEASRKLVLAR